MLAQLAAAHDSIESRGGAVIGIAPAASHQADHLIETGIPFDLFLDPERRVSERVGIGKQSMTRLLFNLPAWWRYIRALLSGNWQRRITGHYSNLPGIVVVNSSGEVTYAHRGTGLGDYPSLESVIAELHSETDKLERS